MEDITFEDCKCDFKVVRKLVNFIAPFEDESNDSSDTGDIFCARNIILQYEVILMKFVRIKEAGKMCRILMF